MMEYPGPWKYEARDAWVVREMSADSLEVWCEFSVPPDSNQMEMLLDWLNGEG